MSESGIVEFYEMPMCGDPRAENVPNPELRQVNQMVKDLQAEGITVKRYLPSENLTEFMKNPKVATLFYQQRLKVLPITLVNGDIVKIESYPTIEEVHGALRSDHERHTG